jgi:hypothetical protein
VLILLRVKLRCEVSRLLLVVEIVIVDVVGFAVIVFVFVVSGVQARSHGAATDLVVEKFFAMLVVVGDLEDLSCVVILHAETIIVIVH